MNHLHRLAADNLGDSRQPLERIAEREEAIEETRSVLTAIIAGGLLDAAPAAPDDYKRHSAAVTLLQMLERRLDALAV